MVDTTLEMISAIDKDKYPSNVTKEYYEVVRELLSILLLLDGYKTYGEGAHKRLIDYIQVNYQEFTQKDLVLIDELRNIRNRIAYDGFFVEKDYIDRKFVSINKVLDKLKTLVAEKLE